MFKKGQLVQSVCTGLMYVVIEQDGTLLKAESIRSKTPFNVSADNMVLIGNNYRATPKCSR